MLELATASDWEAVKRLSKQVHDMHVAWRPDIFAPAEEHFSQEMFDACLEEKQLFVAKLGGVIVGYVRLTMRSYDGPGVVPRKVMNLEELCVDEPLRGQGLGTQIMAEVKILARAFGCTDLQLSTQPENDAAVALYEKAGLKIRSVNFQMKV